MNRRSRKSGLRAAALNNPRVFFDRLRAPARGSFRTRFPLEPAGFGGKSGGTLSTVFMQQRGVRRAAGTRLFFKLFPAVVSR